MKRLNGSPPAIPRSCTRQTQRSNVPATTPEEYHKRAITIPFLDHIETLKHISQISIKKVVMALKIIPSVALQSSVIQGNDAHELVNFFMNDLPSASTVEQEVELWFSKWKNYEGTVPDTPTTSLLHATESIFPNINSLLRLINTLPVTTCECKRSVSVLRRLKTYLRAAMGQTRMTGLALIHVHYGTEIDLEEVINIFAGQHPQRMLL